MIPAEPGDDFAWIIQVVDENYKVHTMTLAEWFEQNLPRETKKQSDMRETIRFALAGEYLTNDGVFLKRVK